MLFRLAIKGIDPPFVGPAALALALPTDAPLAPPPPAADNDPPAPAPRAPHPEKNTSTHFTHNGAPTAAPDHRSAPSSLPSAASASWRSAATSVSCAPAPPRK